MVLLNTHLVVGAAPDGAAPLLQDGNPEVREHDGSHDPEDSGEGGFGVSTESEEPQQLE